ncbi:LacI family DNA-binding transcriptional regulator [Modestobacter sp. VKM Ac-2984]|uniref:LacI family DNA-binding transcriptional regulator n=1 Tax=Modestobacter sp. VKM Ac-2984 TaxID=3004138 RepID=UPI0022A9FFC8|nr:LacI family DNA-binding transcriptional regulator [Modestobacter sp. VKM Ac-2984]MCZ2817221.1 LacI family DNA-binding transcriptional regulator [Modestobacter sp. VKM Ac-2984]
MAARPRIKDVAALAGVAPSTVSAVLNDEGSPRASVATRERVHEAARSLGYVPNGIARGLRTRRSMTLALISDVIATTPYAGQLIQGAQDAAWRAGYLLVLVNTGGNTELEEHAIRALRQQQVDGALYATMYHRVVSVPQGLDGLPVVVLDARPETDGFPCVVPDEEAGARTAVQELARHGHRRIAFVLDERDGPAALGRLRGYRAELARQGLPDDPGRVVRAASDSAGGRRAALELLDQAQPPTAIFAFNDQMAVGVYHAASDRGLRIPEDLSVVGFDDLYVIGRELSPGLTTVALPHYAMGEAATQLLLAQVEGAERPPAVARLVDCPLIRRGSVGPARSPDAPADRG